MRVGIIGCGNVSTNYAAGIGRFPELELIACASRAPDSAMRLASRFGVRAYRTPGELIADSRIEAVVNLTPPGEHASISALALGGGKHVYSEKPLATDLPAAAAVLAQARAAQLLVGAAPDTFLGGGPQRARQLLDEGAIGTPIGCSAFVRSTRPEQWHPDPRFLFQAGSGPELDLGPYYVALLVSLLGPISTVAGLSGTDRGTRRLTAPDRVAETIDVDVPTHLSASLAFASGVVGTMIASFDVWDTRLPFAEIYGDEGTMILGNPDVYDWPVRVKRRTEKTWTAFAPCDDGELARPRAARRLRGIGILDLARAAVGGTQRASGPFAEHVLEVLLAFRTSAERLEAVPIRTTVARPDPWVTAMDPVHPPRPGASRSAVPR